MRKSTASTFSATITSLGARHYKCTFWFQNESIHGSISCSVTVVPFAKHDSALKTQPITSSAALNQAERFLTKFVAFQSYAGS